jgi:hypothetical protein
MAHDDFEARQRNVLPHDQLRNQRSYVRYLAKETLTPLQRVGAAIEGVAAFVIGLGLIVSPLGLFSGIRERGGLLGAVIFLLVAELLCLFLGGSFILFGLRVLKNIRRSSSS